MKNYELLNNYEIWFLNYSTTQHKWQSAKTSLTIQDSNLGPWHYYWTNTRLVCTYFNVFSYWIKLKQNPVKITILTGKKRGKKNFLQQNWLLLSTPGFECRNPKILLYFLKIHGPLWRTTSPILGLFVLIWKHFPHRIQIWQWQFDLWIFWKSLKILTLTCTRHVHGRGFLSASLPGKGLNKGCWILMGIWEEI